MPSPGNSLPFALRTPHGHDEGHHVSHKKPEPRRLTDSYVKKAPLPPVQIIGSSTTPKSPASAFVCTAAGARSFILNYRTRGGKERRYTIGDATNWQCTAARKVAKEIRRKIPDGYDPLSVIEAERGAKTVAGMCARFVEDHLPELRAKTAADYRSMIERDILPAIGRLKLVDVKPDDIDGLHRKISRGHGEHKARPYRANRVAALLSKMFNLAVHRWQWLSANPVRGLKRNQEDKRQRYLINGELQRAHGSACHVRRYAGSRISFVCCY